MSTTTRRHSPLTADPARVDDSDRPSVGTELEIDHHPAVASEADRAERDQRFAAGIRRLRVGGVTFRLEERMLMVAGGVIAPVGVIVVLLGWWGASRTPYVFEQVPYLISGGLLGLGMVFLGAFLYFTHWMTQLVKEQRAQSGAVLEALQRLQDEVARRDTPTAIVHAPERRNGSTPRAPRSGPLVATDRGTMAHRPDCVVVAGKAGLRPVSTEDGLAACKLCEPYADQPA